MTPDKILVLGVGAALIVALYWYFLKKKTALAKIADGSVDIAVDGGYVPEVIQIPKDRGVTINFTRTDPSPCLEEVVIPDFKIRKQLPLREKVSVHIAPTAKGEYTFSCGMNMYHGKIIVA